MKKILHKISSPLALATLSLLIVSSFLRYYLYVNTGQLVREFKNQNYREIYAIDTLKISSRLNSLSGVINWVCLEGSVANKVFYKMEKGQCSSGFFSQRQEILVPEANNIKIIFTLRLPQEVESLFILFIFLQLILISAIIYSTKKSEEEKRQHEIKINKMTRQMFHDIRSPLATLNTIIDNNKDLDTNDQKLLSQAIMRINNIANGLLSNTKESVFISNIPPKIQNTDITKSIQEVIDEKRIEFSRFSNIKINLDIDSITSIAKIDNLEFKRILSNLINNSVEAKKDNSELSISCLVHELPTNKILVSIRDNGIGIKPEILENLGIKEISSKQSGNGIGLIHAFENIHSWGGEISISSSPNQGTCIEIVLPQVISESHYILVDDDELVRLTWESVAKKNKINFSSYSTTGQLVEVIDQFSLNETIFYLDSQLGNNERGEDFARFLHAKGFKSIYMTSGNSADFFQELNFLKGVKDKSPPWQKK